jgi:hypothetical protein
MLAQHYLDTSGPEPNPTASKSTQPTLEDPRFSTNAITISVVPQDAVKLRQLRFLVQNNLAFAVFDSSSWQELAQGRLDSWAPTIKTFFDDNLIH